MTAPAWSAAADYVLPFGQYRGNTLDSIATTDTGLLYLDWLRGEMDRRASGGDPRMSITDCTTHGHICAYLDDPAIARDLTRLVRQ